MRMQETIYVYPNVGRKRTRGEPLRGGLKERWHSARECGCRYIEVPANFLRRKESIPTLNEGAILTREAINELYHKDSNLPSELRYILHTDHELESYHKLEWDNATWRKQFAARALQMRFPDHKRVLWLSWSPCNEEEAPCRYEPG
jgi:hypothetical protein